MNIFWKVIFLFLLPVLVTAQITQVSNERCKRYRSIKKALRRPEAVCILDLSDQKLAEVPPEIGKLVALRGLILSGNEIRELPDFILVLPHLETLVLSHNKLGTLPEGIVELKNLKRLDLQDNCFTTVPSIILQLKEIRYIDLSYNSIPDSEIKEISKALPNCIVRGSPKL